PRIGRRPRSAVIDARSERCLSSRQPTQGKREKREERGLPSADPRVALPIGSRQYHIALGPGELAEYILLPGDPDRTARIAERFESIEVEQRHREFVSATGLYRGQRKSVVSPGIGTDNVEIVLSAILAITDN